MRRSLIAIATALAIFIPAASAENTEAAREALQELNDYIGTWKGSGSNNSKTENWREIVAWSWKFKGKDAWLTVEFTDSKQFGKGELKYDEKNEQYVLTLADKTGKPMTFTGELKKKFLTLDSVDSKSGETTRLTLNTAAEGLRLIYSVSKKNKGSTVYFKQFEVACNKEGESLAGNTGKQPECVVTGGLGTMSVSYMGKTYYVCCSGCRDAFMENPAKVIKEFEERKKKGR